MCVFRSATQAWGWHRRTSIVSSMLFTQPSLMVWAWGLRLAARSWRPMAAVYGPHRISREGRFFNLFYRRIKIRAHDAHIYLQSKLDRGRLLTRAVVVR